MTIATNIPIATTEWLERAREQNDLIEAEFHRLQGSVPYGVCFQLGVSILRRIAGPEEGRRYYQQWRGEEANV